MSSLNCIRKNPRFRRYIASILLVSLLIPSSWAKASQPSLFPLPSLSPTTGHIIDGITYRIPDYETSGILGAAATSGDINGDGLSDLILSAPLASPGGKEAAGQVYVLYGQKNGWKNLFTTLFFLTPAMGLVINGEKGRSSLLSGDVLGESLETGDFNNDGIDDLYIGARQFSIPGEPYKGRVYVIYGRKDMGWTFPLDLSALQPEIGLIIHGMGKFIPPYVYAGSFFGCSLKKGDVNGDSIDDIVIGANAMPRTDSITGLNAGAVCVLYGKKEKYTDSIDFNTITPAQGTCFTGPFSREGVGSSLAVNDLNGDHIDDIVMGAPMASPSGLNGAGKVYIVFGQCGGFSDTKIELSAPSWQGPVINDVKTNGNLNIFDIGDFNQDGFADLLLGSPLAFSEPEDIGGELYFILNAAQKLEIPRNISELLAPDGTTVHGPFFKERCRLLTYFFSCPGLSNGHLIKDFDGDGLPDLAASSFNLSPENKPFSGRVYALSAPPSLLEKDSLKLSNLSSFQGTIFDGEYGNDDNTYADHLGFLGSADFNGDGLSDFILSATGFNNNTGRAYIIYGNKQPTQTTPTQTSQSSLSSTQATSTTTSTSPQGSLFPSFSTTTTSTATSSSLAQTSSTKASSLTTTPSLTTHQTSSDFPWILPVSIVAAVAFIATTAYLVRKWLRRKKRISPSDYLTTRESFS